MKIAIASSGLGHVFRGMETWAESLAASLNEHGILVTLFKGGGLKKNKYDVILPTIGRNSLLAKFISGMSQKGLWRLGLGYPAGVESFIFGSKLLLKVRNQFDLIHLQQASLANYFLKAQSLGIIKTPFIFANGQKGNDQFLNKFQFVQHLTPFREDPSFDRIAEISNENRFVIPNFVDTQIFKPDNKLRSREKLDLPKDRKIILSVGLINSSVKRMDYFIKEMCELQKYRQDLYFVIAGATDLETPKIKQIGKKLLGNNLKIIENLSFDKMPLLYQSADIFVLCSPQEAFGLVLIEAMATKLPVICHTNPIMRWVVGSGGIIIDMKYKNRLTNTLANLLDKPELVVKISEKALKRVQETFSKEIIVHQIIEMYQKVLKGYERVF